MKARGLGFFFLKPESGDIFMLTAEKQVRRVFGCTITQERHSQLHLILLLWHPPAQWDIVTLNPSVFFKAWQAHSSQDSWDILVPVCKHPPDLKVSVCLVSRIPQPRSSVLPSLSLSHTHTHSLQSLFHLFTKDNQSRLNF